MKLFVTILFLILALPGLLGGRAYLKGADRSLWPAVGIFLPAVGATAFALTLLYRNFFY